MIWINWAKSQYRLNEFAGWNQPWKYSCMKMDKSYVSTPCKKRAHLNYAAKSSREMGNFTFEILRGCFSIKGLGSQYQIT